MAERGAYLTGTTYAKPTIFEIVAKESLSSTLEPAFKKIFSFLATCNTERYGWLEKWSDEVYAIFQGALENFYLKNYSASFSETFYSLKRISLINSELGGKLSRRQEKLSLLLIILGPYLKSKAQKYELDENDKAESKEKWKTLLKYYFVKGHKIFQFIYEICGIYYYLAYISDYSSYPTPLFNLLSTTLTYSRPQEILSISEILHKWKQGNFGDEGIRLLQTGFMRSLEFGAFFLQFINWWNREQYHTNITSLPVPPPPKISDLGEKYKGLCPICLKTPNIPTALAVSGYVFCYLCILQKLQTAGKCPITKYPAKEDDLIRIYKNE